MGLKVVGGMYCKRCERPVAAQKTTHRTRGAAGLATGFWPLAVPDDLHCPNCGGPVVSERSVNPLPGDELDARALPWIIGICLVVVVLAGVIK